MRNPDSPKPAFDRETLKEATNVFRALSTEVRLDICLLLLDRPMTEEEITAVYPWVGRIALQTLCSLSVVEKSGDLHFVNPDCARFINFEALGTSVSVHQVGDTVDEKPFDIDRELRKIFRAINESFPKHLRNKWKEYWYQLGKQEARNILQDSQNSKKLLEDLICSIQKQWCIALNLSAEAKNYLGLR